MVIVTLMIAQWSTCLPKDRSFTEWYFLHGATSINFTINLCNMRDNWYSGKLKWHSLVWSDLMYFTPGSQLLNKLRQPQLLKEQFFKKTTRDTHFYSYSMIIKFSKVYSFSSTQPWILHCGDNFIFKYLHEYSAKIKIIPEYL